MAATSYNKIVQFNVSETVAPSPDKLQQTAAIVSIGGTTISAGSRQFIAAPGDLATYLKPAYTVSAISWSTGIVTIETSAAHGIPVGDTTTIQVSGVSPTGYDGIFTATSATTTTLHYAVASNPGAETTLGTVLLGPQIWLSAADLEWWAQGNIGTGYYVYETGTAVPADILTSVGTYLSSYPKTVYNWIFLPGIDAAHSDARAFFLLHNTLDALLKFYLPVTVSTYSAWASEDTLKNVFAMIQSPGANVSSELDVVAFAQYMTAFVPSPTNRLPPSQYRYLAGVTAYSPMTAALNAAYQAGNINYVGTGAEGGISNTILFSGKQLNGTPANVAYSIDWVQIESDLTLSATVINGCNNPLSPLYYNQNGIDRLQQAVAVMANRAIASGLALGQVVQVELDPTTFATNAGLGLYNGNFTINAVPFDTYVSLNPSDYANQLYGGLQVAYTPQYGFETIVFNLNVTQFA